MSGVIFVDEVTYMIVLEAFSQFSNMKLVTGRKENRKCCVLSSINMAFLLVPLNEDGPDVEELKRLIEENKCSTKDKLFWGLYYTIPTYHNPTGRLFSESEFFLILLSYLFCIIFNTNNVNCRDLPTDFRSKQRK